MRILQVGSDNYRVPTDPELSVDSIGNMIYYYSRILADMGHEVHIISLGKEKHIQLSKNLHFHYFSLSAYTPLATFIGLINKANKNMPFNAFHIGRLLNIISKNYGMVDCIFNHYFSTSLAPVLWKKFTSAKTKIVFVAHGAGRRNLISDTIFKNYDKIYAVSSYVKRKFIEAGFPEKKVCIIPNAIDTQLYNFSEKGREEFRKKINSEDADYLISFVGRIIPEKGIHLLIKALPHILKQFPKTLLTIAGPQVSNEYLSFVKKLVNKVGVSNNIRWVGVIPRSELIKLYSASDICVVPSIWEEPFGIVVLEAMSCSRPVIAFEVGGIPDIIKDRYNGFLVREKTPEALASKVMEVLGDEVLRHRISINARKTIESQYAIEIVAQKYIQSVQ